MSQPIHTLTLTNAAATSLVQLITARGLITDENKLLRVSKFGRKNLRKLPDSPTRTEDAPTWSEQTFATVEVKEKTRDALKELVKSAAAKGVLSGGFGDGDLLEVLGLAEADE